MELVITITLWCLFSGFLVFPHLRVPQMLTAATAMLLALEFVAALTWGFAHGTPLGDTAGAAAGTDVPLLSIVVLVLVIANGLRAGSPTSGAASRPESRRGSGASNTR